MMLKVVFGMAVICGFATYAAAEHTDNWVFGFTADISYGMPKKNPCHEKATKAECVSCCTTDKPAADPAKGYTAWSRYSVIGGGWFSVPWSTVVDPAAIFVGRLQGGCLAMCDEMTARGHMTTDAPTKGPTATTGSPTATTNSPTATTGSPTKSPTTSPTTASPTVDIPALHDRLDELNSEIANLEQADRDLRAVCVPSCEIAGCGAMLADSIGCYCDDICGKYGDCCPDYAEACPRESCEWEGTWYQGDNDGPMDLDILLDENNDISGVGDDEIGEFTLEGHATPKSIHLIKRYDDSGVTLVYGGASLDGIHFSGTWSATGYDEKGTFELTAPDEFLCTPQALCTEKDCGKKSTQGDCYCDGGCIGYGDCCVGFDFEATCA